MDFRLTPEQEAFRSELRTWLDRNAVEIFGKYGAPRFHANDEEWARLMEWHRRLHRAGYIALAWPKEWGGAGAGLVEQIVYQDEMSNRGLPPYSVAMQAITLRNGDPSAERDQILRRDDSQPVANAAVRG